MKWYEQRFVSRRDWILDHLELLGLNEKETVIVLLIDFLNEHHLGISIDTLHQKTGISDEEVNRVISVLCAKRYLEIGVRSGETYFSLDGLYETNIARSERVLDNSLFDVFESELARPLSPKEMEKISDWNSTTDKKLILYALRQASTYQPKKPIEYIDAVLRKWKQKNLTAEDIENGKGNDDARDS